MQRCVRRVRGEKTQQAVACPMCSVRDLKERQVTKTLYRWARRYDERPRLIYGVSRSLSLRGKGFPCSSRDRSYLCRPFLSYRLNRRTLLLLLLLRSVPQASTQIPFPSSRKDGARCEHNPGNPGNRVYQNDANKNARDVCESSSADQGPIVFCGPPFVLSI